MVLVWSLVMGLVQLLDMLSEKALAQLSVKESEWLLEVLLGKESVIWFHNK